MRLEELLKKGELSTSEASEMLYLIKTERKDDEKKIELYNHAIHQASKYGIELLYKIYKDTETYGLDEEEKKLLQGNVTFYIGKQDNMTPENIQQMLYFVRTERKDDEKKIELYNHAIHQASKFGIELLYKIYKDIETYGLNEEEKKLLQGNIEFYISEQERNNVEQNKRHR